MKGEGKRRNVTGHIARNGIKTTHTLSPHSISYTVYSKSTSESRENTTVRQKTSERRHELAWIFLLFTGKERSGIAAARAAPKSKAKRYFFSINIDRTTSWSLQTTIFIHFLRFEANTRLGLVWFSVALRPQRRVGLLGTGTGTEWEGGERVKGSTAETARKRPERPWTAAKTVEVLRRCPLAIAQRLVHCAIAVSTAVLDRVTKTMSVAPLLTNNLDNSKQKTSNLLSPSPPPYSWSLLGKVEGPAPPPSSKISWSFDLAWNPYCDTRLPFGVL